MKLKLADIIDVKGNILDYENLIKKITNNPLIRTFNRESSIS